MTEVKLDDSKQPIILWAIFVTALALRIILALVNRESNDDHWQVIALIFLGLFILVSVFMSVVPFAGPYWSTYQKSGSPFSTNITKDPAPPFAKDTFVRRPGITSIISGYFTFRFIDLIQNPHINKEETGYHLNRTSLWSQLYGRLNFIQFSSGPPTWYSNNPFVLNVGRSIFILALLPLFMLLSGFWSTLLTAWREREQVNSESRVFVVFALGFLLMLIKLSYEYRDFCTMKIIYIFPGILCAVKFFASGLENFLQKYADRPRFLKHVVIATFGILAILYISDVLTLIQALLKTA